MLNELAVERLAFDRLAGVGYRTGEGTAYSPDDPAAMRTTWEQALLGPTVRERLAALNASVGPAEIDGVVRMLDILSDEFLERVAAMEQRSGA